MQALCTLGVLSIAWKKIAVSVVAKLYFLVIITAIPPSHMLHSNVNCHSTIKSEFRFHHPLESGQDLRLLESIEYSVISEGP